MAASRRARGGLRTGSSSLVSAVRKGAKNLTLGVEIVVVVAHFPLAQILGRLRAACAQVVSGRVDGVGIGSI